MPSAAPSPVTPCKSTTFQGAPIVFGLAVGGLATAAYIGAAIVRSIGSVAVPVASITALLLLASTRLIRRVARWAGAPRPAWCAAWSLLGVFPILLLGTTIAVGNDPVLASSWRCGTGDAGLMLLSPIAFALAGTIGGLLAFALTSLRRRVGGSAWAGVVARGALIGGAILVAAAAARAVHHPSSDHGRSFIAALPTVAVLAPIDPATARVVVTTRESAASLTELVDEAQLLDITVRRTCAEGSCSVALRRTGGAAPPERMWAQQGSVRADESVAVQRDEKHGFWIVGGSSAFRDNDLVLSDIGVRDIGDALSAPPGWIGGGAIGVLVALGLWGRRRILARRMRAIEAGRVGTLGHNGWLSFHDDMPARRASPDLALSAGPVVLLTTAAAGGAAGVYRSEGAAGEGEIVAGSREDLVAALRARMADLDALGFAAALLTAAPLLASWSAGLLF